MRDEDQGVRARDSLVLSALTRGGWEKAGATHLEEKMTKMAIALLVNELTEEKQRRQVQGMASITVMAGSKMVINNVVGIKYIYVLFHSGEQLFLTLEGKGRKGMKVAVEWLAKVERVEALIQEGQKPGLMILAERKVTSQLAACNFLPLQCPMEGNPR